MSKLNRREGIDPTPLLSSFHHAAASFPLWCKDARPVGPAPSSVTIGRLANMDDDRRLNMQRSHR